MSRYIDADKLLDKLSRMIDFCENHKVNGLNALFQVGDAIMDCPTADVEEVRHGEWNTECVASTSGGFEWYTHTCSNCGKYYRTVMPNGYNYCQNCGAKMDGERSENGK